MKKIFLAFLFCASFTFTMDTPLIEKVNEKTKLSFQRLPAELQLYIFNLLGDSLDESIAEIQNARFVCRAWNNLISGNPITIIEDLKTRYGKHEMIVSAKYGYPREINFSEGPLNGSIPFKHVYKSWKKGGKKLKKIYYKHIGTNILNDFSNLYELIDEDPQQKIDKYKTKLVNQIAKADVNYQSKKGLTALMEAVPFGDSELIKLLLDNGADPNLKDKDGMTALMLAVALGQVEAAELLIQYGAKVNISHSKIDDDSENNSKCRMYPLGYAILSDATVISEAIKEFEDIAENTEHEEDFHLNLPDEVTFTQRQAQLVKLLLQNGANPHVKFYNEISPLHACAYKGNYEAMEHLLDYEANPNPSAKISKPPLMYAAKYGHLDCVRLLLKAGASPITKYLKKGNKTALDYARDKGHKDIISLLEPITKEAKKQEQFEKNKKIMMSAWFGDETSSSKFTQKEIRKISGERWHRPTSNISGLIGTAVQVRTPPVAAPPQAPPAVVAPVPAIPMAPPGAQLSIFQKIKTHAKVLTPIALGSGIFGLSCGNLISSILHGSYSDQLISTPIYLLSFLPHIYLARYSHSQQTTSTISDIATAGALVSFGLGFAEGFLDGNYFRTTPKVQLPSLLDFKT